MFRFAVLGFVILSFCCPIFVCDTTSAFQLKSAAPDGNARDATTNPPTSYVPQREVINIVVDKIEDGVIYSKDGRTFQITSATKVVNNAGKATALRTAELVFQNSSLVTVIIK